MSGNYDTIVKQEFLMDNEALAADIKPKIEVVYDEGALSSLCDNRIEFHDPLIHEPARSEDTVYVNEQEKTHEGSKGFMVVETQEHRSPLLLACPSNWLVGEKFLKWPSTKDVFTVNKLLHDASSVPGKNWIQCDCSFKRGPFLTFQEAQKFCNDMLSRSQTETTSDKVPVINPHIHKPKTNEKNFYNMSHTMRVANKKNSGLVTTSNIPFKQPHSILPPPPQTTAAVAIPNVASMVPLNEPQSSAANNHNLPTDNTTDDSLHRLIQQQFTKLEMKLDKNKQEVVNHIKKEVVNELRDTLSTVLTQFMTKMETLVNQKFDRRPSRMVPKPFEMITNVEEMQIFNTNLGQQDFFNSCRDYYLTVFEEGGPGYGRTICMNLYNDIFERGFMKMISWTGRGANKATTKVPFRDFVNIRRLFLTVASDMDETFVDDQLHDFGVSYIRHGGISTHKRKSSSKARPKQIGKFARLNAKFNEASTSNSIDFAPTSSYIKAASNGDLNEEESSNSDYCENFVQTSF